jgi:membrane-associated phospholipid phosphatase
LKRKLFLIFLFLVFSIAFSSELFNEFESDIKSLKFDSKILIFTPTFLLDKDLQNVFANKYEYSLVNFINNMDEVDFLLLTLGVSGMQIFNYPYTSFTVLESVAVSTFFTYSLKFLVGRARPNYSSSPYVFKPFSFKYEFNSFPSGHSAIAWAIFTPIAEKYNKIIYLVPTIFSFSRILGNYHWTSDVIFGAIIGYSIGNVFYKNKSVP